MSEQPPTPPQQPYYPPLPPSAWPNPYPVAVPQPSNPLATAGMILGIICCVFVAAGLAELAMCILAMTFGGMAMGAQRRHLGGRGKAQAGLILGIIGLVIYAIVGIASAGITLLV